MIISDKPNYVKKIKLTNFKNKYISLYPDYLQEEINEKLMLGYTNNNDTINQIYCYLNLVNDSINAYKGFINILENNFDLNRNILEVGAGTIPILSKYLSDEKVNVDILEPNIIFDIITKGKIIKEKFTNKTNINDYDLIIGYNPCQATESIIKNSIKHNKDFCIALCGCCFLPEKYTNRTPEEWHKYLLDVAKKLGKGNYEIKLEYFDDRYKIEYPIIIGKLKSEVQI